MYCAACGIPVSPGLSYCNRCGSSLKERSESRTGGITAFLTAITLIGTIGLGIMLGGALTLKNEANLPDEIIGFFMFFTFLIVVITEILLVRQLSRLTSAKEQPKLDVPQQRFIAPAEMTPVPHPRALGDAPSVTESTTRTLEYSRHEPLK